MDRQPRGYEDVAFGLLVGVAAVAGVFWAGGAASAWASGHRLPHGEPLAGLAALAHLSDPSSSVALACRSAGDLLGVHGGGARRRRFGRLCRVAALALRRRCQQDDLSCAGRRARATQ